MTCEHCYFCGRDRDEIEAVLIAAYPESEIAICDECVRKCQRIVATHKAGQIFAKVRESVFSEMWGTD
jgi:ATP-dependent protease Clp ATPase subunit